MTRTVTFATDVRWGVQRGFALAAIYCLWASIVYAMAGAEAFTRKHTTYGAVVATYLAIGVVSGAIVGAGRAHATTEGRCLLLGLAAGFPIAIGLLLAVYGMPGAWPASTRLFLPIYGVGAGWFLGHELDKARRAKLTRGDQSPSAS